jgi:hypothetical protein
VVEPTISVKRVFGGVQVQDEVDAGISQSTHALVVVCGVVHSVDSDGVDAQLLEFHDISLASSGVSDGVSDIRRSSRLVINASDVETAASGKESCSTKSESQS